MSTLREAVSDFLAQRRVAVAGVSRDGTHAANLVYRRMREKGYQVFAVNPNADEVEGDPCYHTVGEVPGGVAAVFIATPPSAAPDVVRECAAAGVPRVWMHRSFGTGSVSAEAARLCDENGIRVIAGACPMMYLEPVDPGHRCMRWILGVTRRLPA
jgi:uncharacterized protein